MSSDSRAPAWSALPDGARPCGVSYDEAGRLEMRSGGAGVKTGSGARGAAATKPCESAGGFAMKMSGTSSTGAGGASAVSCCTGCGTRGGGAVADGAGRGRYGELTGSGGGDARAAGRAATATGDGRESAEHHCAACASVRARTARQYAAILSPNALGHHRREERQRDDGRLDGGALRREVEEAAERRHRHRREARLLGLFAAREDDIRGGGSSQSPTAAWCCAIMKGAAVRESAGVARSVTAWCALYARQETARESIFPRRTTGGVFERGSAWPKC